MFFKPLTQGDKHKTFEIVVYPKPRDFLYFILHLKTMADPNNENSSRNKRMY